MALSGNISSRDFLADRQQHHWRMKLKTDRLSWLISRTWCQGLLRVRELDSQVVKKEPRAEILGSGCGLTVSIMRKIKDVQGPGARPCVWRIRSLEKAALCLFHYRDTNGLAR